MDLPAVDRDLARLTPGEKLRLYRRRRRWGQDEMGSRVMGTGHDRVGEMERDRRPIPERPLNGAAPHRLVAVRRSLDQLKPTLTEQLQLARRRTGISAWELAKAIGVSRTMLNRYERAGHPRVVEWWRSRGFTFI